MNEPILTRQARADLRAIWLQVARGRDAATADRMTATILEKTMAHAQFPETGRLREELAPGLRSFPVAPYVIFFRPVGTTIVVLRILHGHRDIDQIMSDSES